MPLWWRQSIRDEPLRRRNKSHCRDRAAPGPVRLHFDLHRPVLMLHVGQSRERGQAEQVADAVHIFGAAACHRILLDVAHCAPVRAMRDAHMRLLRHAGKLASALRR